MDATAEFVIRFCDGALRQAIHLAATHDRLYLPHNSVCRMTKVQSERFLQLPPDYRVSGRLYRDQRTRAAPGGMWVVRGEFFLRYKMDERFCGWGGEDTELLGRIPRIRLSGPLFHLWHAPADRSSLRRNRRLLSRIRRQRRRMARSVVPRFTLHANVPMQQHPDVAPALRSLFADYPPMRILEIGTGAGGFALLLRELRGAVGTLHFRDVGSGQSKVGWRRSERQRSVTGESIPSKSHAKAPRREASSTGSAFATLRLREMDRERRGMGRSVGCLDRSSVSSMPPAGFGVLPATCW